MEKQTTVRRLSMQFQPQSYDELKVYFSSISPAVSLPSVVRFPGYTSLWVYNHCSLVHQLLLLKLTAQLIASLVL
jgi:hypothetical protein